jgi:hypothetical protein
MDISALFTGIKDTIASLGGVVTTVFDFIGKGKMDETEAMKQYYILQLKIKDLESYANQLQLSLTEKMMVGATWTKYIAMTTGFSIIAICIFNIVCRAFGWSLEVTVFSWEILALLGLFIFSASGSTQVLLILADNAAKYLIGKQNETKPASGDSPDATKTGG